jgi:hypothetical protein
VGSGVEVWSDPPPELDPESEPEWSSVGSGVWFEPEWSLLPE